MKKNDKILGVIGLGYVGLPVAISFAKKHKVIGFDIESGRIRELRKGYDKNGEEGKSDILVPNIEYTDKMEDLRPANVFIVTVPTPIDQARKPNLSVLFSATETVGTVLKKGDIVVYESTVYPGATEEECVPILERASGLKCGKDFKVGYSPERINPGDREHTFEKIMKVVSGQDEESLNIIADLYGSVVKAGIHRAASIKVAEAAKIIENTQRDLNIALMNELALIFDRMGIDSHDVLEAAGTKWNFLKFTPGLVGGHCIGVDPYYLTYKSEKFGYIPQVILAGRRVNDNLGAFVAQRTLKEIMRSGQELNSCSVIVLGLAFKENCKDIRNSKAVDIVRELSDYGIEVRVYDPLVYPEEVEKEYGISLTKEWEALGSANAVVMAVAHNEFREMSTEKLMTLLKPKGVFIDVKGILNRNKLKEHGVHLWRL